MFARTLISVAVLAFAVALAARPSGGSGSEQRYVVKRYDTLWSIAASHYAGDPRDGIWRIERRNHLPGAAIAVGEMLVLPP